jgi:uncharacterized protein (DUF1697 family)
MGVMVAMLRGVNVGGKNPVKMETLRAMCSSLGCTDVATYVQSGNVVFRTRERSLPAMTKRLEAAIEKEFGFSAAVTLRTAADLRRVVAANPFPEQAKSEPGKLLVTFLYDDPGDARRETVRAMKFEPELVRIEGREMYTYYPLGQGQSKLRWGPIDKALGTSGTARNWNSVTQLLAMAESLE